MRSLRTAAVLATLLALTGCGSGGGDADDVPTITTRPSVTSTEASTVTSGPASASTDTASTDTGSPKPTETTVAPPTSAPPPDDARGPTTYDDALDRINTLAADGATEFEGRFATPGDDVYCLLDDPVIGPSCELGNGFISDPDVCGADSTDRVGRIETFKGKVRPVCNADTIREPGAPTIAPDAAVVDGDVTCGVEKFGVTCIDRVAGQGFFLGRGEYHVFTRAN